MYEKFTDRARRAMHFAKELAYAVKNNDYIKPSHVLLGIIEEGNGLGVSVLRESPLFSHLKALAKADAGVPCFEKTLSVPPQPFSSYEACPFEVVGRGDKARRQLCRDRTFGTRSVEDSGFRN
jgi:hypothetical protein